MWTIEQQMVLPLLILAPLSNNPLYLFCAYHPFSVWAVVDAIVSPLFHAAALLVSLILFDGLLHKNVTVTYQSWLFKIVSILPVFAAQAASGLHSVYVSYVGPEVPPSQVGDCCSVSEAIGYLVFIVLLISVIAKIMVAPDVTESFRFNLYVAASGFLALEAVFEILNAWVQFFPGTTIDWVVSFTIHNLFTLMMVFFHWPYEFLHDQSHQIGSKDQLFVNSFDLDLVDPASDSDAADE
jgi:hypothetical protein